MIWVFVGIIGGLAVVAVAAWARTSQRRVEADQAKRREQARLDAEEAALLAKLREKDQE